MKLFGLLSTLLVSSAAALASTPYTPGDLLVYRVGSNAGTTAEVNTGNQVYIDQWTTSGAYVSSYATGIFASGTATSEGALNLSPDGSDVTYTGYATTSASSLSGTTGSSVNRTVGILGQSGGITNTNFSDFSSGNNPRAAVTTNGTDLWMVGGAGSIRYGTTAGGTSTQLSSGTANLRDVEVVNGQLYVSSASSGTTLATVGSGTPKTAGQTITNLPGFPAGGSAYGFYFADLSSAVAGVDTLYVADDTAGNGQIQKFSLEAGNWVGKGSITALGVRGLTGAVVNGNVALFGTTGSSAAAGSGSIYSFNDATGYDASVSGSVSTIATNATLEAALGGTGSNYAFRGIVLTPIPEASTYALIAGCGALGFTLISRRKAARVEKQC